MNRCAVGVRSSFKREISRWLEPMVSGELTAASAHRSKVHSTTSPLQSLALLLSLLLILAGARIARSLSFRAKS